MKKIFNKRFANKSITIYRKFNYGQWLVEITIKDYSGYGLDSILAEPYCHVDCTGSWYSTSGIMYDYYRDCVAYDEPEILPKKLKEKIYNSCKSMLAQMY